MQKEELHSMQYPIGQFVKPRSATPEDIGQWIGTLEKFPEKLRTLVVPLTNDQLNTPYRPGGWTVRQTVHHLGDSHMNAYIRFKWTLTENKPVIKAYYEDRWAALPDSLQTGIISSLNFLDLMHERLVLLLRNLKANEWEKTFIHPDTGAEHRLDSYLALYAWHSEHHYAHIQRLAEREGWQI